MSKNNLEKDIWIEYWGMEDTIDYQKKIEYNGKKEIKKGIYIKKGLFLIEIFPSDLKNLEEKFTLKLREAGIKI